MRFGPEETQRERDRIELEAEELFRARQRLIQGRLLDEEGPSVGGEYKSIRNREEELRYRLLLLENEIQSGRDTPRSVRPPNPLNRPLQRWTFLLMIVTGVAVLLLSWWGGKGSKRGEPEPSEQGHGDSSEPRKATPDPSDLQ
ncbi:MAG: hypothetical protein HUU16_07280 [Candidatus Omnitrophica bacterium]|nr:hypothetical protein [Candidatus Omnitrophota bacterium]